MNDIILVSGGFDPVHSGHIQLIQEASKYGSVIEALTKDKEIFDCKGFHPELNFSQRSKILKSIPKSCLILSSVFLLVFLHSPISSPISSHPSLHTCLCIPVSSHLHSHLSGVRARGGVRRRGRRRLRPELLRLPTQCKVRRGSRRRRCWFR